MTADEVRRIVHSEIGDAWGERNSHDVDLRKCLVPPRRVRARAGWNVKQWLDLWIVLEERPGDHDGYLIAFDDAEQSFGLATRGFDGELVFNGYNGPFLAALEGM